MTYAACAGGTRSRCGDQRQTKTTRVESLRHRRGATCYARSLPLLVGSIMRRSTAGAVQAIQALGAVDAKPPNSAHVATVIKAAVAAAGLNCHDYWGHSFRAGFVTTAAMARVSTFDIKRVTRQRSDEDLANYYRNTKFHVAEVL